GLSDGVNQGAPGFSCAGSVGWFSGNAGIWANGSNVGAFSPSIVPTTKFGLCVDTTGKLAWPTIDGSNYYGASGTARTASDVAAGTDGFNLATYITGGTFYGAVGCIDSITEVFTIQTTLPGGWTQPSGYSII